MTVINKDSSNIKAYLFMATSYQELEKFDSSLYFYEKALALNPSNSVCYYHRAILYIETKKYNDAVTDLNRVLDLNPRNLFSYYLRGVAKIYLKDYEGAEDDFSKAIELYPLLLDAYRSRAYARAIQNKMDGYFKDQSVVDSLFKKGGEYIEEEDLDYFKSITDFRADFTDVTAVSNKKVQYIEQTIRMLSIYHPIVIDTLGYEKNILLDEYLNYSEINVPLKLVNYDYSNLDDIQIADLKYKIDSSLNSFPDSLKYELLKALVLGWQMEYSIANSVIDDIENQQSSNLMLYFIEANHNYFIGNVMSSVDIKHFVIDKSVQVDLSKKEDKVVNEYYESAIDNYDKAIELNSEFIYSYYNRAYVNSLLMNYNQAIQDYSYCIDANNNFSEALYNRGLLNIYLDNYTEGCKDLSKAGELGIDNAYRVIYKYCKD
jgi:tetratricopeptide (TPR) repeat protein